MRTREIPEAGGVAELLGSMGEGEEVVLTVRHVPVGRLVRLGSHRGNRQFGFARGRLRVHEDFDAPLAALDPYRR